MATVRAGLRAQGLRPSAVTASLGARRDSTQRLYGYRWSLWFGFCSRHGVRPLHPRSRDVVNFLSTLHDTKHLTAQTLAGYRSAITNTIAAATGSSQSRLSASPLIGNFLDGLRHAEVHAPLRCPQWDLTVVLDSLRRQPYEPLASASLADLTRKTAFLLALASAARVSSLHGLSGLASDISLHADSVTINFLPEFRAKTQAANVRSTPLTVPALSSILAPDDDDIALCPIRSLRKYLNRVKHLRGSRRRLFLSLNPAFQSDITKSTLSRWLTVVVRLAYNRAGIMPPGVITAHEIRAVSTSMAEARGVTLERLMAAASWRGETTFAHFYLRDLSTVAMDGSRRFTAAVLAQQPLRL